MGIGKLTEMVIERLFVPTVAVIMSILNLAVLASFGINWVKNMPETLPVYIVVIILIAQRNILLIYQYSPF